MIIDDLSKIITKLTDIRYVNYISLMDDGIAFVRVIDGKRWYAYFPYSEIQEFNASDSYASFVFKTGLEVKAIYDEEFGLGCSFTFFNGKRYEK